MKYPIRRQTPQRTIPLKHYKDYKRYKEFLSHDFNNCCGYCGIHHMYFGYQNGFHIDHFAPKSKFPLLINVYTNLVYACPVCNLAKHDDWCSDNADLAVQGERGYIDPCSNEYDQVFYRDNFGRIRFSPNSNIGNYMFFRMKFFLKRHEIFWLIEYFDGVLKDLKEIFDKMNSSELPYFWEIKNLISRLQTMRDKYKIAQQTLHE